MLPKQWEVFEPIEGVDYDVRCYQGGFGAGKSFTGVILGAHVLSQNPGSQWLVGADTWSRLNKTTWEVWLEMLDLAQIRCKSNESKKLIKIPDWDARVLFCGLDDPDALRSVNGIGGHLEEASLILEMSYLEFLGRCRQAKAGTPIQIALTTNPQAAKGWIYDHFFLRAGVSEMEIRNETVTISRRRVIASTLENPHVSNAFIAMLKASYDPELFAIVVEGKDGDYTRGLVSHNFSDLNIQNTQYKPDLTINLTCDFNVDPNCWELAHRYNDEYHFFDEICIENTNINECIDEFVKRYPDHSAGVVINGDASGGSRNVQNNQVGGTSYTEMINRLNFHKYPSRVRVDVRENNPLIPDRIAAWNAAMCNTNGVRRIFINPKCKRLIQNLNDLKWKEGGGGIALPTESDLKRDPKLKFLGHPFDAASYLVEKYDPIKIRPSGGQKGKIHRTKLGYKV